MACFLSLLVLCCQIIEARSDLLIYNDNNNNSTMCMGRKELLSLRKVNIRLPDSVWLTLKETGILKPVRGSRGGRRKRHVTATPTSTPHQKQAKICFLNAHSVKNKTLFLADYITEHDIDLMAIAETWLGTSTDATVISELLPAGYDIKHIPRQGKSAGYGGVGLIHKSSISVKTTDSSLTNKFESFEHMECRIMINTFQFVLCVVYRPPPSRANKLRTSTFLEEWSTFLDRYTTIVPGILITGDINLHLEDKHNHDAERFRCLVDDHGMRQHVSEPTHSRGHTLDIVLTRDPDTLLCSQVQVSDPGVSDHMAITCQISVTKPKAARQKLSYRRYKDIDLEDFRNDLSNSFCIQSDMTIEDMVSAYDSQLRSLVDTHAPLMQKTVTLRPQAQWYNSTLRGEKVKKRNLERKWRKSKLTVFKEAYREQSSKYNSLLQEARTLHYSSKVESCGRDPKAVFRMTNQLLGKKSGSSLPEHVSSKTLAETFSTYFTTKIAKIRESLGLDDTNTALSQDVADHADSMHSVLESFNLATEAEVHKIITQSPTKSCEIDPLPTSLLKDCLNELVPHITRIVNQSLISATVPGALKNAVIRPFLKKSQFRPRRA